MREVEPFAVWCSYCGKDTWTNLEGNYQPCCDDCRARFAEEKQLEELSKGKKS